MPGLQQLRDDHGLAVLGRFNLYRVKDGTAELGSRYQRDLTAGPSEGGNG
jgi:hypothetical protein